MSKWTAYIQFINSSLTVHYSVVNLIKDIIVSWSSLNVTLFQTLFDKKLSYRKQTMRLLHNIEITVLH